VNQDIEKILFSEKDIESAIDRIAAELSTVFGGERSAHKELLVVSVLKGSCIFTADLIRRIPIALKLAFVAASSYRDGTDSGSLRLSFFPSEAEIAGRNVLLVDDILDTGRTLAALTEELLARGAASVRSCVFLDKPARRLATYEADFRCFEIEDLFVVGYGLDYQGRYRNLPFIGSLKPALFEVT